MDKNKPVHPPKSRSREIIGIVLIALAVFLSVALFTYDSLDWPGSSKAFDEPFKNKVGWIGALVSYEFFNLIGFSSFAFLLMLILAGVIIFFHKSLKLLMEPYLFLIVAGFFMPLIGALAFDIGSDNTRMEPAFKYGGVIGGLFAHFLVTYLGKIGAFVLSIAAILITIVVTTNFKLSSILESFGKIVKSIFIGIVNIFRKEKIRKPSKLETERNTLAVKPQVPDDENPFLSPLEDENAPENPENFNEPPIKPKKSVPPIIPVTEAKRAEAECYLLKKYEKEKALNANGCEKVIPGEYILPGPELLDEPRVDNLNETREEMLEQAQRIVESLRHFNIESEVKQITPGPIITRYELTLAPGVKVGRVVGLSNDLSMALRAKGSIRILAPIPGKAAIGIEVPNKVRSTVYFRDIAESDVFRNAEQPLTIAVGKSTSGEPVVADLAKMPHLLIAGSTGSGKSVCIHSIVVSILMKAAPSQVRMLMIDPKMVELNIYNSIPHLLTSVIIDPKKAAGSLKWAVGEMENRYRKLASIGVRDIYQYNEKIKKLKQPGDSASGSKNESSGAKPDNHEHLPLIVIVIDEFADLMVVASNEIEESIARLAQMARAVGIHLILATQRPSADVITGLIKANFPSRIAFKVMQSANSRIILDEGGADKLLGMGDMLFLQVGKPESVRLHGAYITNDECNRVVEFVSSQVKGQYDRFSEEVFVEEEEDDENFLGMRDPNDRDPLFFEAARLVVRHNQGSVSLLQRRLKVGYARAARLIDQLEMAAIVSPYDGSKAREILVDDLYIDELEKGGL